MPLYKHARSKPENKNGFKHLLAMMNRANKRIDRIEQKVAGLSSVVQSVSSKLDFFADAVSININVTDDLVDMVEEYI